MSTELLGMLLSANILLAVIIIYRNESRRVNQYKNTVSLKNYQELYNSYQAMRDQRDELLNKLWAAENKE